MKRTGNIVELEFRNSRLSRVGVEVITLAQVRARAASLMGVPQRPDFLQLLLIERGCGVHMIDFVEHPLSAGSLVIVRPGQVQQWVEHAGVRGTLVIISDVVLPPPLAGRTSDAPLLRLDDWPAVSRLEPGRRMTLRGDIKRLSADIEQSNEGELDAAIVRHATLALILRLARDLVGGNASCSHETRIFRLFRRELEARILDRKGVQHYVERLGYSHSTLSRACLACAGLTAKQLIDRRTILEAKRLLVHSEATTAEIAHHLGFSEPTNFVKFFRRLVGITPTAFRARPGSPDRAASV